MLDVFCGVVVEFLVFESFCEPGGVEAKVDADVAVLFEAVVVELGAKAEDFDSGGLGFPEGVEGSGFCDLIGGCVGSPELPAHLELVGHVVVELLGGLGDGVFDDGGGGVFGAVVVDVDALVGGGFGEADGIDAGGGDAGVPADGGELAHDRDHRCGEGV